MQSVNAKSFLNSFVGNKPKIIFFHIPKTGGSSVAAGFRRRYRLSHFHIRSKPSSQAAESLYNVTPESPNYLHYRQQLRQSLVFYTAMQDIRFITGHFCYDQQFGRLREKGYHLVSFLRNPVDRFISSYFYRRYKKREYSKIYESFEDYINSSSALDDGCTYIRFIGGIQPDEDPRSQQVIARAKENVKSFDEIGLLEDMESFQKSVFENIGVKIRIPHKRDNPAKQRKDVLEDYKEVKNSPSVRNRIAEICQPDLELFEFIRHKQHS